MRTKSSGHDARATIVSTRIGPSRLLWSLQQDFPFCVVTARLGQCPVVVVGRVGPSSLRRWRAKRCASGSVGWGDPWATPVLDNIRFIHTTIDEVTSDPAKLASAGGAC